MHLFRASIAFPASDEPVVHVLLVLIEELLPPVATGQGVGGAFPPEGEAGALCLPADQDKGAGAGVEGAGSGPGSGGRPSCVE